MKITKTFLKQVIKEELSRIYEQEESGKGIEDNIGVYESDDMDQTMLMSMIHVYQHLVKTPEKQQLLKPDFPLVGIVRVTPEQGTRTAKIVFATPQDKRTFDKEVAGELNIQPVNFSPS